MRRAAAALLPVALLAIACGREADSGASQHEALELVVAAKPLSFDPAKAGWVGNLILQRQVLETLVEYDPDRPPDGIQGLLADHWSVDEDGLRWSFRLREGARFHDPAATPLWPGGEREVLAADVVHSWERLRDPAIGADADWAMEVIDSLRAMNDRTLEVRLTRRDDSFLRRISTQSFAVVPAELEAHDDRSYRDTPVGSAPYALAEWTPGQGARFRRVAETPSFDSSGHPIARISELRFDYVDDSTLRTELFKRGASARYSPAQDAHARMLPGGQLAPELAERGITVHHAEIPDVTLLIFQMEDPSIGNVSGDADGNQQRLLLRRALAAAFPREDWASLVRPNNSGTVARNFLPPLLEGWKEAPEFAWTGGQSQAADLLAEAGWPNGVGAPAIRFDAADATALERAISNLLVASWQELGLEVSTTNHADFASLQQAAGRGETMIMLRTWVLDWPDPALLFDAFDGKLIDGFTNLSRFRDEDFDRLLVEFRSASIEQRRALSPQLCAILNNLVPAAPIDHRGGVLLVQPWLLDFRLHPFDPYACKFWAISEVAD